MLTYLRFPNYLFTRHNLLKMKSRWKIDESFICIWLYLQINVLEKGNELVAETLHT